MSKHDLKPRWIRRPGSLCPIRRSINRESRSYATGPANSKRLARPRFSLTEDPLLLRRITRLVSLFVCACALIGATSSTPLNAAFTESFTAHAQVNSASLTGLIADQTNAALVHAHVTATNSATAWRSGTSTWRSCPSCSTAVWSMGRAPASGLCFRSRA